MKLLTARLISEPRNVQTKTGGRMVADAKTTSGETLTVWRPEADPALGALTSGALVTLTVDSRGKVNLIDADETQTAPALTETPNPDKPKPTMTTAQKKEVAQYVEDMAALYAFCYSQAGAKLPDAPPETRQACASSLFIASQRRFNLA